MRVVGALVLAAMVVGNPFIAAPVVSLSIRGLLTLVVVGELMKAIGQFDRLLGGRHFAVGLRDG